MAVGATIDARDDAGLHEQREHDERARQRDGESAHLRDRSSMPDGSHAAPAERCRSTSSIRRTTSTPVRVFERGAVPRVTDAMKSIICRRPGRRSRSAASMWPLPTFIRVARVTDPTASRPVSNTRTHPSGSVVADDHLSEPTTVARLMLAGESQDNSRWAIRPEGYASVAKHDIRLAGTDARSAGDRHNRRALVDPGQQHREFTRRQVPHDAGIDTMLTEACSSDRDGEHLAKLPRLDQGCDVADRGAVEGWMAGHHDQTQTVTELHQVDRLSGRRGQGVLHQHVLAGGKARGGQAVAGGDGRCDHDRLDCRIFEYPREVADQWDVRDAR